MPVRLVPAAGHASMRSASSGAREGQLVGHPQIQSGATDQHRHHSQWASCRSFPSEPQCLSEVAELGMQCPAVVVAAAEVVSFTGEGQ